MRNSFFLCVQQFNKPVFVIFFFRYIFSFFFFFSLFFIFLSITDDRRVFTLISLFDLYFLVFFFFFFLKTETKFTKKIFVQLENKIKKNLNTCRLFDSSKTPLNTHSGSLSMIRLFAHTHTHTKLINFFCLVRISLLSFITKNNNNKRILIIVFFFQNKKLG